MKKKEKKTRGKTFGKWENLYVGYRVVKKILGVHQEKGNDRGEVQRFQRRKTDKEYKGEKNGRKNRKKQKESSEAM